MLHVHLVAYTAHTADGITQGIASVLTEHWRPSWQECGEQIPGYLCDEELDPAPEYTLRYTTDRGTSEKPALDFVGVQRVGTLVMRFADRGKAWDIAVLDDNGHDVTFNFPVFCA